MPTSKAAPRDALENPALSESVRALARRGEVRSYRKGTLLIQEGDLGDMIYVILGGRLRAYATDPRSQREFIYNDYVQGQYVGEMGLDGGRRSANVIALEPSVCAVVSRGAVEAQIAETPAFAFELMAKLIWVARQATQNAKLMALVDTYGRLRALLEGLARPQDDGTRRVPGKVTHKQLSERVGCSREMVSRLTKDLENSGHLARTSDDGWVLLKRLP
jgi:CRP/FNR family cyclic AMP-dependent transcriptional regulator